MAKRQGKIYLGYDDEPITDKSLTLLNHTVNKIGGTPNWPPVPNLQFPPKCPLCGLHRLLIVQCYAPLENSVYHRTLYIFACINPNCWTQSESWLCLRTQYQEHATESSAVVSMPSPELNVSWCEGADDWDENDNGDTANGNIMNMDNVASPNVIQRNSDDDESNSFELESVEQAMGNLQVFDAHNANMSPVQGAVGADGVPVAAAELEGGDEPGLVTVDTPTAPPKYVEELLNQTAELPVDIRSRLMCSPSSVQFLPKFIYVEEEWKKSASNDDKVAELLNKYSTENEIEQGMGDRAGGGEDEVYEEAAPLHGDRLFHAFLSRLRNNPGQILRYSRWAGPLLGAGGAEAAAACARCGGRAACELQLVPEFAESLRVLPHNIPLSHLHFLSVLIFTCSQSCWQPSDTAVKEIVVFQPEVL